MAHILYADILDNTYWIESRFKILKHSNELQCYHYVCAKDDTIYLIYIHIHVFQCYLYNFWHNKHFRAKLSASRANYRHGIIVYKIALFSMYYLRLIPTIYWCILCRHCFIIHQFFKLFILQINCIGKVPWILSNYISVCVQFACLVAFVKCWGFFSLFLVLFYQSEYL